MNFIDCDTTFFVREYWDGTLIQLKILDYSYKSSNELNNATVKFVAVMTEEANIHVMLLLNWK